MSLIIYNRLTIDWFTFISNKNDYNNKIKISELRNKNVEPYFNFKLFIGSISLRE